MDVRIIDDTLTIYGRYGTVELIQGNEYRVSFGMSNTPRYFKKEQLEFL